MLARGKLGLLNSDGSPDNIFFNDNLTQANGELFWLARAREKERGYKFVCVKNTRISARKKVGAPLVKLQQQNALDLITEPP